LEKLSDYSEKEILQLHGFGKNTMMKLKDYMKEHQVCFKEAYKVKKFIVPLRSERNKLLLNAKALFSLLYIFFIMKHYYCESGNTKHRIKNARSR
jgi:uncharacterized membrane protein (DUF106 family)